MYVYMYVYSLYTHMDKNLLSRVHAHKIKADFIFCARQSHIKNKNNKTG